MSGVTFDEMLPNYNFNCRRNATDWLAVAATTPIFGKADGAGARKAA
jgi:hypothetical protein